MKTASSRTSSGSYGLSYDAPRSTASSSFPYCGTCRALGVTASSVSGWRTGTTSPGNRFGISANETVYSTARFSDTSKSSSRRLNR